MVRLLHTADIHLDSPFSLFDAEKAAARRNELRGTFSSLMLYIKTEHVNVALLAGDLFDSEYATRDTLELMRTQFEQNPECRFVIAPGNHDPLTQKGAYRKTEFPSNVYIFDSDDITKFSFDDIGVDVYGWAFTEETKEENPLRKGRIALDRSKINILCVHADMLSQNSRYCPMTEEDIASSGFDYVALGHVHTGGEVKKAGNTYYAYSGCLEGRSFDECGAKGAIVIKADPGHLGNEFRFEKKRFSLRKYEKMTVDVSNSRDSDEVLAKVRTAVKETGYGDDTILRVKLNGVVSPSLKIDANKITAAALGVFYLELSDDTSPTLDYNELMNDISIRGALFRELLPKLQSENEDERRLAAAALRYGLTALEGGEIN